MNLSQIGRLTVLSLVAVTLAPAPWITVAYGQVLSGEDAANEEDGGGNEDPTRPTGQAVTGNTAGVSINAFRVLQLRSTVSVSSDLDQVRRSSAAARSRPSSKRPAKLRFVSLTRLQAAAKLRIAAGKPLTEEMRSLADLAQAEFIHVCPKTGEVVIVGRVSPESSRDPGSADAQTTAPAIETDGGISRTRPQPKTDIEPAQLTPNLPQNRRVQPPADLAAEKWWWD